MSGLAAVLLSDISEVLAIVMAEEEKRVAASAEAVMRIRILRIVVLVLSIIQIYRKYSGRATAIGRMRLPGVSFRDRNS